MAAFSNPAYPNCSVACDRCFSPLLDGNAIKFTGISAETGEYVSGVFGPDCIYHLTGDKNPRYSTIKGVYDPAAAKAAREAKQAEYDRKEQEKLAQIEAKREQYSAENKWLIEVLSAASRCSGDFCSNMVKDLEVSPLSEECFSFRCLCIMRSIYAKSFGRGGSKKHTQAEEFFDSKTAWAE